MFFIEYRGGILMILSPIINKKSKTPIYMQLYNYIKDEIISGILRAGQKIPSIREAATGLKLSKTTIENAYYQLVVEGYIENIPKKGYFVIELSNYNHLENTDKISKTILKSNNIINSKSYINDGVDATSFDLKLWKKTYNKVIQEYESSLYFGCNLQGEKELREQISNFVKTN
jgi:GntR family transcriptional regulator/MocR family aminotransferase